MYGSANPWNRLRNCTSLSEAVFSGRSLDGIDKTIVTWDSQVEFNHAVWLGLHIYHVRSLLFKLCMIVELLWLIYGGISAPLCYLIGMYLPCGNAFMLKRHPCRVPYRNAVLMLRKYNNALGKEK